MKRIKIKDTVLSYDTEADALYVQMSEGKVAKTVEYGEGVYVDLNSNGRVVGIEFLSPSEVSSSDVKKIAAKFHTPNLRTINPAAVPEVYACA